MRASRVWDSFVAIFRKEFVHIRRDRTTLLLALSIPIFQITLFGFLDQTVRHVPTVVVDQSHTQASRELMDELEATGTFRVVLVTADTHQARSAITRGEVRAGVVIPPDFGAKWSRVPHGPGAQVLVLIDGSDSVVSGQVLAAINGLAARRNLEVVQSLAPERQPFAAQPLILFNPAGRTANYIIPGLVAIMLQISAVILTAVSIVREREKGSLEQLMVTPVDPLGLMLGKLAPYLLLSIVEMGLILLVMRFGFSVPIRGSVGFLFGVAVVYLLALLAVGLLISTRAQTQAQALQMAQLPLLPSIFLSGYIFPVAGLPWLLYALGRLLPATHMIEIMRGVVLRGAGPGDLLVHVLALLAICVLLIALSVRRFRKVAL